MHQIGSQIASKQNETRQSICEDCFDHWGMLGRVINYYSNIAQTPNVLGVNGRNLATSKALF